MSAHIPRTEYANAGRSIGGAYASLAAASGLSLSDILLLAERGELHRAMPCVEVRARERRRIAGANRSRERLLEVLQQRWGTADGAVVGTGTCPGCGFGGYRSGTPCCACTYNGEPAAY
jgi:hypothetical protein